eukprot:3240125-Prorocentrum_lima.AAC.1
MCRNTVLATWLPIREADSRTWCPSPPRTSVGAVLRRPLIALTPTPTSRGLAEVGVLAGASRGGSSVGALSRSPLL